MNKLLTIGMAVYDDYHGTYFTIQSLRMINEICQSKDVEFLVIDNQPKTPHGEATKHFCKHSVPNAKYIPYTNKTSTSIRNEIFKNAEGKYCLCLDCHVLLYPNSLNSLLDYYNKNPDCKNLIHGPLVNDHLKDPIYTHMAPEWGEWMYGKWRTHNEAVKKQEPFSIPMQGLGLFSCETKNWLGFSELFRGFGGEEGYIHEKFRQNGGDVVCIPQLKWVHRFGRPGGPPYPNKPADRIWNYFVGWLELTKDPEHKMIKDIYRVFKNKHKDIDNIFSEARIATGI